MRINQFIAQATGLSRRAVDRAIHDNRVTVNNRAAVMGQVIKDGDNVQLDEQIIEKKLKRTTILLNKPSGYVCSRNGQGSKTIYDLLPNDYHDLKTVGRLDKDSSGIILLTDDGYLAHNLTHPGFNKSKAYLVRLSKQLTDISKEEIEAGKVILDDKPSHFKISYENSRNTYKVTLFEGRNRQIRRTFEQLGYQVVSLQRISFGNYKIEQLEGDLYKVLD